MDPPPRRFKPPRCPNQGCARFVDPVVRGRRGRRRRFYQRHGVYNTLCRGEVPRFRCLTCTKTFSYQTFRHDYYDKKPELNAQLFDRLTASGGLRESSFRTQLERSNLEFKHRKIARTLSCLHRNMTGQFPANSHFVFDEMESFEDNRRTRPVTITLLVEAGSFFIVEADCAPIRPRGRMNPERRQQIALDELRFGKRQDLSIPCIRKAFRYLASKVVEHPHVFLDTDKKTAYRPLARQELGAERLVHRTTSSKAPRTTGNPLFAVNLMEAIARDYTGRLRRRTWLCSKMLEYLQVQLQLLVAFRNYIRPKTRARRNRRVTSGMALGFARRMLSFADCLSWRQDWGLLSIRPDYPGLVSFAEVQTQAR
ncbi:MAG: hypothetical protein ACYTKC_20155 [Planctomycetota bacterium]